MTLAAGMTNLLAWQKSPCTCQHVISRSGSSGTTTAETAAQVSSGNA